MRFGPAGNEDSFYAQGYKNTWQAMAWLREMGLDAYEYPFGRGVRLSAESAAQIRAEAEGNGITVSAHAPYYINLTNPDPEKKEASFRYLLDGLTALRALGGREMVVHIGSQMKMQRDEALKMCREHLKEALRRLDDAGFADMTLCPETMGKKGQIGDLEETLDFCLLDERLTPCIDFAHLHALGGGCLRGTEDFARVLDRAEQVLGLPRARRMHVHFSTIEFTAAGEKQHRTFAEEGYGPRFEHLAPLFRERGYDATVICECRGTMATDARAMKTIYEQT